MLVFVIMQSALHATMRGLVSQWPASLHHLAQNANNVLANETLCHTDWIVKNIRHVSEVRNLLTHYLNMLSKFVLKCTTGKLSHAHKIESSINYFHSWCSHDLKFRSTVVNAGTSANCAHG